MKSEAFCPGHVTGFFTPKNGGPAVQSGSVGAGFSVKAGVATSVDAARSSASDWQVRCTGYRPDDLRVSEAVIKLYEEAADSPLRARVEHSIAIPVGYGLGCSAAAALSLSLALNESLELRLPKQEAGRIAHEAEVECRTGLGDVLAAYHGGMEIRVRAGAPGTGSVRSVASDSHVVIGCFAPVSTAGFIADRLDGINGLGEQMAGRLAGSADWQGDFQDMSVEFAEKISVITPEMRGAISEMKKAGIKCGVAMVGETVFALARPGREEEAAKILGRRGAMVLHSSVDSSGARLQGA